jgi:hypothetical protein
MVEVGRTDGGQEEGDQMTQSSRKTGGISFQNQLHRIATTVNYHVYFKIVQNRFKRLSL